MWIDLRFTADGKRLAALDGLEVTFWDPATGRRLHSLKLRDWASTASRHSP